MYANPIAHLLETPIGFIHTVYLLDFYHFSYTDRVINELSQRSRMEIHLHHHALHKIQHCLLCLQKLFDGIHLLEFGSFHFSSYSQVLGMTFVEGSDGNY